MVLKAVVETLDDIDPVLHDEYTEVDGKFYLQLDDTIKVHTAVTPLARALETVKAEKTRHKKDADELRAKAEKLPDNFDREQYDRDIEELQRLRTTGGAGASAEELQRTREQLEQRIQAAEQRRVEELRVKDVEIERRDNLLDSNIATVALAGAIRSAEIDPKFEPAVRALLRPQIRVNRDPDTGEREAYVKTDLGDVTVAEYVVNWTKSDDGKIYVPAPSGGGARGTSLTDRIAKNPFSHEHWNATEQGRLITTRGLDYATRMATGAGTTIGGPRPAPRQSAA